MKVYQANSEVENEDKNLFITANSIKLYSKKSILLPSMSYKEEYNWDEYVEKIQSYLKSLKNLLALLCQLKMLKLGEHEI